MFTILVLCCYCSWSQVFNEKAWYKTMFKFIQKVFIVAMGFTGFNAIVNVNPLKCVSIKNQECKVRLAMININSNETLFYPHSILANKCSGICNNINDPYAKLCVPDVVIDMNIKVFNLMSRTNGTRRASWHEICKYRLDASVYNNRPRWNRYRCRCDSKNWLKKVDVIMDLFGILEYVNVMNHVMLENI